MAAQLGVNMEGELRRAAAGMAALEAGHAATEWPAVRVLREGLQKALNEMCIRDRLYSVLFLLIQKSAKVFLRARGIYFLCRLRAAGR